jgi:hypothetical protein
MHRAQALLAELRELCCVHLCLCHARAGPAVCVTRHVRGLRRDRVDGYSLTVMTPSTNVRVNVKPLSSEFRQILVHEELSDFRGSF